MPLDEFIINIYLMVEEYYNLVIQKPLRRGGFAPKLSDTEIICMELVGEFMGMDQDKQIWQYFKHHWLSWFPGLGSYPNFAKQCANLYFVKQHIQQRVAQTQVNNIHFIDGFPIPVCKYTRAYRYKMFEAEASFSYCASKQEKYYGFAVHLLINLSGMIKGFTFASAAIDERDVAPEEANNIHGLLGADKGYIRPELKQHFASRGVHIQTPLRCNMKDSRFKSDVNRLMCCRRNIETVIGQLSESFNIQKVRAKDLWHLSHRLTRKILAHNFCFILNKKLGNPPLQFDLLLKC